MPVIDLEGGSNRSCTAWRKMQHEGAQACLASTSRMEKVQAVEWKFIVYCLVGVSYVMLLVTEAILQALHASKDIQM